MRIISSAARRCLPFIAGLALFWPAALLRAEADLVGIVVDYQPRARVASKAVVFIKRTDESDKHPVREHEMIYEGDRIIFDAAAGPNAFVKVLVASREAVTIDPAHPEFPKQSRSFLASWVPKLLAAYRWINPASEEVDEPRNALSRAEEEEPDDLSVLPRSKGPLKISDQASAPLWIGWTGGVPPFKVSLSNPDKPTLQRTICGDGGEEKCARETLFEDLGNGRQTLTLTVLSGDGTSWSREIGREVVTWNDGLAHPGTNDDLSWFLRATDLLDRKDGDYVLESARELNAISATYPPARTLLEHIKGGRIP